MKKAWNIIRKIIVWAIVVFSLGMMAFTIISVTTFDRADRSVFGYSAFIVLSDSMKATDFDAGDLVIIKQTDPSTLKEGDIISFQSPDESNYGEIVTHKIREVTTDDEGHPGFITYGTTTDSNDQGIVTYNLVIGKYQGHIPKVGTFFNFLKSVPGYFICIFTPFFILILVQARNSIKLFRKYKKEQMEEIQAEKKSLEEERVKSQAMMEQLMQMQQEAADVFISDEILEYISLLTAKTRQNEAITLGISPRGALALSRMARARAYLCDRDYVIPEDVQEIFTDVCGHRLVLDPKARINRVTAEHVLRQILQETEAPGVE